MGLVILNIAYHKIEENEGVLGVHNLENKNTHWLLMINSWNYI